jgi:hypothetical protein
MPPALHLILLESPWCVKVHQGGIIMFRPMVQELLNVEKRCYWKFKKINIKNCVMFLVLLETLQWVKFNGGDIVIFRPKVHNIYILNKYLSLEIQ